MTDAFALKDHQHNLSVLITNSEDDPVPAITFMDKSTGQQVSISANVFFQMVDAIDYALEGLGEMEPADEPPPVSKLN